MRGGLRLFFFGKSVFVKHPKQYILTCLFNIQMYIIFLPSYVKCYGPILDTFAVPAARYLRQPQVVL